MRVFQNNVAVIFRVLVQQSLLANLASYTHQRIYNDSICRIYKNLYIYIFKV